MKIGTVVQLHHDAKRRHWIASAQLVGENDVRVYDSAKRADSDSRPVLSPCVHTQLQDIYGDTCNITFPLMSQQMNGVDCGLYAIAAITDICYGRDPSDRQYVWESNTMRRHLIGCMLDGILSPFPAVLRQKSSNV